MNPQYPRAKASAPRRAALATADPLPTSTYRGQLKNFRAGNFPKQVADHKKSVTISTLEL